MPEADVIVVGSGLSGLHAAYPLVKAGLRVHMLDVGIDESAVLEKGVPRTFEETRRTDAAQHTVFLGENLSGIGAGPHDAGHAGSMTSGRREYIVRDAKQRLPVEKHDTVITETLAAGGLSEAWGAVCDFFDTEERGAVGIPEDLHKHYAEIIARIGVSGKKSGYELDSPALLDDNHALLERRYRMDEQFSSSNGFTLEQSNLAMLTQDRGDRKKTAYRDMDFWDNIGRPVYRGHYTLEELRAHENFTYMKDVLVTDVRDDGATVTVAAGDAEYHARTVIMAAGAVNTTRILLRSFKKYDQPVPVILKNNYLVPGVVLSRLGKRGNERRHSLCQLTLSSTDKKSGMTAVYAQLYSYHSLLLYKLLRYVPLPAPYALKALSLLVPAMVLADIRFPSTSSSERTSCLRKKPDGSDYLEITYPYPEEERREHEKAVSKTKRALRRLGLLPLTSVRSPFGATSHYAGGIPFSNEKSDMLTVNARGQLHQAPRIFVADMASWRALPAKPPGLTLMANANRIGHCVRDYLNV